MTGRTRLHGGVAPVGVLCLLSTFEAPLDICGGLSDVRLCWVHSNPKGPKEANIDCILQQEVNGGKEKPYFMAASLQSAIGESL